MSAFETSYINLANSNSKGLKELDEGLGDTGLRSKAQMRETQSCPVRTACASSVRGSIAARLWGGET